MFSAYFDASGTKLSSVLTVTGYVSRVTKWVRFDQEWKAILVRHGVNQFHMTDFVSQQREFMLWRKRSSDERRNLITELVACIKRNTNKGFSASVIMDDYNRVNSEYPLEECAGLPFALCARTCMGLLKSWAEKKSVQMKNIAVYFEDGDQDKGDFVKRSALEGVSVTLLAKACSPAFQAADLAAWKVRTVLNNASKVSSEIDALNILRSLRVVQHTLADNGVFNAAALRHLSLKGGVAKRESVSL